MPTTSPGKRSIAAHPGSKMVVYSYNYGGVLAQYLTERLAKHYITVDLLITVDAAEGPVSSLINRKIGKNVKKNF